MKTKIILYTAILALTLYNCSNDDDNASAPSVAELLASGPWYFETTSLIPLDDCQKNTYINFLQNGNAYSETYGLNDEEVCVIIFVNSGTYTLLNDSQIEMTYEGETNSSLIIVDITESQLILRDESGSEYNTIILDKTQG